MKRLSLLLVAAMLPGGARADEAQTFELRIATPAPDGTAWAREAKAFAREVELKTNGGLRMKFYWGGVAGDDVEML